MEIGDAIYVLINALIALYIMDRNKPYWIPNESLMNISQMSDWRVIEFII